MKNVPEQSAKPLTEDVALGEWVYCHQHLRPHRSGWCTVNIDEKVGLGSFSGTEDEQLYAANAKCKRLEFRLYNPTKS